MVVWCQMESERLFNLRFSERSGEKRQVETIVSVCINRIILPSID